MGCHPEFLESKTVRALDDEADCRASCGACPPFIIIYDLLVVTCNSS